MKCTKSKITKYHGMWSESHYISHHHFIFQELSIDDDLWGTLYLLKNNTEYTLLVLEYIQAVRLLQLKEAQFKEIGRSLKGYLQEKVKLKICYLLILFRKC